VRNVASELGQHTAEIFGRLGVSESEIEKLRAQGVVCWSRIETGRATP
jgi:crotonobetainyl-CoA:carnitine CoA-transferase CaiB-like acyl-CoA transferase